MLADNGIICVHDFYQNNKNGPLVLIMNFVFRKLFLKILHYFILIKFMVKNEPTICQH